MPRGEEGGWFVLTTDERPWFEGEGKQRGNDGWLEPCRVDASGGAAFFGVAECCGGALLKPFRQLGEGVVGGCAAVCLLEMGK